MLLAAVAVAVCACDGKNQPDQKKTDYDKMVGNWNVSSYTVKWINLDESKTLKDISLNEGSLSVSKKTEDGDTYFYYTEDFIIGKHEAYSGRLDVSDNGIELRDSDGFLRKDDADSYEFTVSFPSANQMEWVYEWKGSRSVDGVAHQEQRSVKAVFNKK